MDFYSTVCCIIMCCTATGFDLDLFYMIVTVFCLTVSWSYKRMIRCLLSFLCFSSKIFTSMTGKRSNKSTLDEIADRLLSPASKLAKTAKPFYVSSSAKAAVSRPEWCESFKVMESWSKKQTRHITDLSGEYVSLVTKTYDGKERTVLKMKLSLKDFSEQVPHLMEVLDPIISVERWEDDFKTPWEVYFENWEDDTYVIININVKKNEFLPTAAVVNEMEKSTMVRNNALASMVEAPVPILVKAYITVFPYIGMDVNSPRKGGISFSLEANLIVKS